MALRQILHHPDPRLRFKARAVGRFDATLATLIEDMFETMYAAPGIGLAATQIDVQLRVVVVDVSPDKSIPHYFVNPTSLPAGVVKKPKRDVCRCPVSSILCNAPNGYASQPSTAVA